MVDLAVFRISGVEFCVAFVVNNRKAFDILKVTGAMYGLVIDTIADQKDGDIVCAVTGRDDSHPAKEANSFFQVLKRNEKDWIQDWMTIDGQRTLIFYSREVLS